MDPVGNFNKNLRSFRPPKKFAYSETACLGVSWVSCGDLASQLGWLGVGIRSMVMVPGFVKKTQASNRIFTYMSPWIWPNFHLRNLIFPSFSGSHAFCFLVDINFHNLTSRNAGTISETNPVAFHPSAAAERSAALPLVHAPPRTSNKGRWPPRHARCYCWHWRAACKTFGFFFWRRLQVLDDIYSCMVLWSNWQQIMFV